VPTAMKGRSIPMQSQTRRGIPSGRPPEATDRSPMAHPSDHRCHNVRVPGQPGTSKPTPMWPFID
jgi:hypothetical protein